MFENGNRSCDHCGAEIEGTTALLYWSGSVFCSRDCADKSMKNSTFENEEVLRADHHRRSGRLDSNQNHQGTAPRPNSGRRRKMPG